MRSSEFLQDAIGQIDDDLILEAKRGKGRTVARKVLAAAAACAVLAVGCLGQFLRGWYRKPDTPTTGQLKVAENLWQREDFGAFSLNYRQTGVRLSTCSETTTVTVDKETTVPTLVSKPISITQDQTIKLESLIAQRYAVYYGEQGELIFYDTTEDQKVDLRLLLLGADMPTLEPLLEKAQILAEQMYPGMLSTENNRDIFIHYLECCAENAPVLGYENAVPDTEFIIQIQPNYYDWDTDALRAVFSSFCWEVYCATLRECDDSYIYAPYRVEPYALDPVNGICLLGVRDIAGNGCGVFVFDFQTGEYSSLHNSSLTGMMLTDGYSFRFSGDGKIATVVYPDAGLGGDNLDKDLTERYRFPSKQRYVASYKGETVGVFCFDSGSSYQLGIPGASEAFVSDGGGVVYYKQMHKTASGKSFYCSDRVWYDRLRRIDRDSDTWVFHTIGEPKWKSITLPGRFVRFAAEETAVIMEQAGAYCVYSLANGRQITDELKDGTIPIMAHERLQVVYEDGWLYKRDMFTEGEPERIIPADDYILSSDGAFAFAYLQGDGYVTCVNIASGESCRIEMDRSLADQFFYTKNAVFRMNYNETENTLTLSFYVAEDQAEDWASGVDFYALVEELGSEKPQDNLHTELTVSQSVLEAFRKSADAIEAGHYSSQELYPCGLTGYEDRFSVFEKLELTPPDDYLDVNGAYFVLYEAPGERIALEFYEGWLLYDFETVRGFLLTYSRNGVEHNFFI